MVEEAAGTSTYESKRDQTNKLIEKKDAKLNEMDTVSKANKHIQFWHRLWEVSQYNPVIISFISLYYLIKIN